MLWVLGCRRRTWSVTATRTGHLCRAAARAAPSTRRSVGRMVAFSQAANRVYRDENPLRHPGAHECCGLRGDVRLLLVVAPRRTSVTVTLVPSVP